MNRLSTRKVGGFHEKSHSVHEIEIITDRTEQIPAALYEGNSRPFCRELPKKS
jgi:hypothetical protein